MSASFLLATYLPTMSARAAHLFIEELKAEIRKEMQAEIQQLRTEIALERVFYGEGIPE